MIRTQTPMQKIVSTFKNLGWAIFGLRYAFISPSELRNRWKEDNAPSLSNLFLGSITAFLLLVNILGERGVYDDLLGRSGVHASLEQPVPNSSLSDGRRVDAVEDLIGPVPPDAAIGQPEAEELLLDEPIIDEPIVIDEGPVGIPAKIWSYTKDFIFTAFIMALYPSLILFTSVPIILLIAPRVDGETASEGFEDALNYVFFQTLNTLVIWALLAAAASLMWQLVVSVLNVFGFLEDWLVNILPTSTVLLNFPDSISVILSSAGFGPVVPVLIVLLGCLSAFSALIMLSWHILGRARFLSPLTCGFFVGVFLVPFYPLTFFPYLRHVWILVLWLCSALMVSIWAPVALALLVLLAFRTAVGYAELGLERLRQN